MLKVEKVGKKSFPFNMRCNVSTLHSMLKKDAIARGSILGNLLKHGEMFQHYISFVLSGCQNNIWNLYIASSI